MTREEKVMKLLQEEFGIHNEHELDLAIANMEKVNISSGPIHVYKGKNISAAGKLGDYILFINTFMKGMAASTIIHVDGKKYMPDTMYTIGRDGKVYEKE